MTRKTKPYWQIEMAAENMLKQCGCFGIPYQSIDFMIESCKIDIIPLDIKNNMLLGLFGRDDYGNRFIGFNKGMIPERILFTKAHELGHFVLEHKLSGEFLTDERFGSKDPQEIEANVFAAALLMPKKSVINILEKSLTLLSVPNCKDEIFDYNNLSAAQQNFVVKQMKQAFHTSKQSIELRIKNVELKV
jgi:Zn-dependent peptidase ImmA (M78 family)